LSPIYLALFLILAVVLLNFARSEDLRRRTHALLRVEAKLDLLLQHEGIRYEPFKGLPDAAAAALERGEKIAAIKAYRTATQTSLKEAKERIEEAQRLGGL
jgi:hypothetical protein